MATIADLRRILYGGSPQVERTCEIIVSNDAVRALIRMGDLPRDGFEKYMSARQDGRYNLRVSEALRRNLDRILVAAGHGNHSDAILAIEQVARHTESRNE